MKVTLQDLAIFTGGQLEEVCKLGRHRYRSEIESIEVQGKLITVTFAWSAQLEGGKHWIKLTKPQQVFNLGNTALDSYWVTELSRDRVVIESSDAKIFTFHKFRDSSNIQRPKV